MRIPVRRALIVTRLRSPVGSWLLALILSAFLAPAAHAHFPLKGANDVLGGALHPFVTPAHVLVLLGVGLLIGQRLKRHFDLLTMGFAPAAAIALASTAWHWIGGVPVPAFVVLALVVGGLVALDRDLPPVAAGALVVAAAFAIGFDSGLEPGSTNSTARTLIGTWIGLCVGLANIAYYVSLAAESGRKWLAIAIRVAGSWLAAISLLMLAFSLRK